MERSLGFWREALGAEVVLDQISQGTYLGQIVGASGARGHVPCICGCRAVSSGSSSMSTWSRRGAVCAGATDRRRLTRVAVAGSDLRALLHGLWRAAGRPFSDPVRIDAGASEGTLGLYVRDPNGHTLELIQPAS
jgi:catechol 2,3-dioxygenase-like lactoylglutathione lyase family enzyme